MVDETSAVKGHPRNYTPRPQVLHDLSALPAYPGACTERLRDGEHGEVVLDCGGAGDMATMDGGKTWRPYAGTRLWPAGYFGPFDTGDDLVALPPNPWEELKALPPGQFAGSGIMRSRDGGRIWREEEAIPPAAPTDRFPRLRGPQIFGVTVTRTGRIIVPETYCTGDEGSDPDVIFTLTSGDGGHMWQRSAAIGPADPCPNGTEGWGEPSVAELPDGRLWMVFRTVFGELWQCVSSDGGLTWSSPSPTGLASPLANAIAARVPGSDAVLLIWNFARPGPSGEWGAGSSELNVWGPREPLVFAVSHDSCRTWSCPTVIYDGRAVYPNVHFSETQIYICFSGCPTFGGPALAVYDRREVLGQSAWTRETIKPYIDAGLVAPWLSLAIP